MSKQTKAERIGDEIVVDNPTCLHCGNGSQTRVDWLAYALWQGGDLIQHAFPHLNDTQRESLTTGFCGSCQDDLYDSLMEMQGDYIARESE